MVYTLLFFLFKMQFHNSKVFGSCVIHILYTRCAKIKKNNSGAKMLTVSGLESKGEGNAKGHPVTGPRRPKGVVDV